MDWYVALFGVAIGLLSGVYWEVREEGFSPGDAVNLVIGVVLLGVAGLSWTRSARKEGDGVNSPETMMTRSGWVSLASGVFPVGNHVFFDTPRFTFWLGVVAVPAAILVIVAGNRALRSSTGCGEEP